MEPKGSQVTSFRDLFINRFKIQDPNLLTDTDVEILCEQVPQGSPDWGRQGHEGTMESLGPQDLQGLLDSLERWGPPGLATAVVVKEEGIQQVQLTGRTLSRQPERNDRSRSASLNAMMIIQHRTIVQYDT